MRKLVLTFGLIIFIASCSNKIENEFNEKKRIEDINLKQNYDLLQRIINNHDSLFFYIKMQPSHTKIYSDYKSENDQKLKRLKKYLDDYFSNGFEITSEEISSNYQDIEIKSLVKDKYLMFCFKFDEKYKWFLIGIK